MKGFSKLSKNEKINFISKGDKDIKNILSQYINTNKKLQALHDDISENTLSNFYLPFGVAPNFLINDKEYNIPMVIEESSVVAAASNSAKFWKERGGFKTKILGTKKIGHIHFFLNDNIKKLKSRFIELKNKFIEDTKGITENMTKRGGGILDISLIEKFSVEMKNYYQIKVTFETKDSMGANFINSCLEQFGKTLEKEVKDVEIIMCILSNYTPECIVRSEVSCSFDKLKFEDVEGKDFANKFYSAVRIAEIDSYRATTHNKGIMNGIDALVLATGNDFRAVEAGVHTYASKNGKYSSLSHCSIKDNIFRFWLDIPLAVGTVGGLTTLHPLAKLTLKILDSPSAKELMEIIAALGLAQNFSAIKSLITTGIQKGHMKMHLSNILNSFDITKNEKEILTKIFEYKTVSVFEVSEELKKLRKK